MQDLVKKLFTSLKKENMRLAIAESCTGGLVCAHLTKKAGASAYLDRGFVTYSNEAKNEQLGVPLLTIEAHGAVSEECAIAMAQGALSKSNANISISITGIAGPEGGSKEKPIGTVWFGFASSQKKAYALCKNFDGDRETIQQKAAKTALKLLISHCEGRDLSP